MNFRDKDYVDLENFSSALLRFQRMNVLLKCQFIDIEILMFCL